MSVGVVPAPGLGATTLGRALRRSWYIVAAVSVLGAVAGFAYAGSATPTFSASASVVVNPISDTLFPNANRLQVVNAQSETITMSSNQVRRLAAQALDDGTTPLDLGEATQVSSPDQSLVINVDAKGPSGEVAAARANAMVNAFLSFRSSEAAQKRDSHVTALDEAISNLGGRTDPAVLAELQLERAQAAAVAIDPGVVIHEAVAPDTASAPATIVLTAAGTALGFLLGVALAAWREVGSGRLVSVSDVVASIPGREPAFAQEITLSQRALSGDEWDSGNRDEVLLLAAAIRRLDHEAPTVALLGSAPQSGLAEALSTALSTGSDDDAQGTQVRDLTGHSPGAAARDAVGVDAVVVAAVAGRSRKRDLAAGPARSLSAVPIDVPIGVVLVRTARAKASAPASTDPTTEQA